MVSASHLTPVTFATGEAIADATEGERFASPLIKAGYVRCPIDHPCFGERGLVAGFRFVFPRRAVWIKPSRGRRFVSDPTVVEYYSDGDEFLRAPLDPRGDRTDWYEVREAEVRDAMRRHDPAWADKAVPFRFSHAPTDDRAYALQRRLSRQLEFRSDLNVLAVEEAVISLLDRVLAVGCGGARKRHGMVITRDEREIADRAAAVLSQMTSTRVTLTTISRAAGVSVFHLSRIFRKVTGQTLAKRHLQVRLLASLTPLGESGSGIAEIAVNHGFVGHSHYTSVFRRVFGFAPSTYRGLATARRRRTIDSLRLPRAQGSDTRWREFEPPIVSRDIGEPSPPLVQRRRGCATG